MSSESPIVAPLPLAQGRAGAPAGAAAAGVANARPLAPVRRWRLWAASLLIGVGGLLALVRGLGEPSLGWRFEAAALGTVRAVSTADASLRLDDVRALASSDERVAITPLVVIESAGIHNSYADQNAFFARQAAIWRIEHAPRVTIEHAGGTLEVVPRHKTVGELGLRFWFPWCVALLSLSVGLAVWVFRAGDAGARCYALSSLGYAFGMLCTAGWGSRLLTQPPFAWPELHVLSHLASFMLLGGLAALLWFSPTRLGTVFAPRGGAPWADRAVTGLFTAWALASVLAEQFRWVPTIALAFRLPLTLLALPLLALYLLQWRVARGDPVKRAQLKWLGLLLAMGLTSVFVAYAVGSTGRVVDIPQNYGLAVIAIVFLGLVPLVTRVGLFRLERWWARAWLWFLGGVLVLLLDLLIVAALPVTHGTSISLALALAGWLYFPLRQALWRRLFDAALPTPQEVLPDIVALVTAGGAEPAVLNQRWHALWEKVFAPQSMRVLESGASSPVARVDDLGQTLRLPGHGALDALELTLAARGTRLFTPRDARRAEEIGRLVRHALAAHDAFDRGAREERQRIAMDLHDDLGARLLGIAQAGLRLRGDGEGGATGGERVAELARQALDEMRLSVRGLTAGPARADEVLADWRAETVTRLTAAGIAPGWQADAPPPSLMLPARTHVQLTRVLREAVSNAIRHSGARLCSVQVHFDAGTLALDVRDDGRGIDAQAGGARRDGVGLAGIERRVRGLGGRHTLRAAPGGGAWLRVEIPLGAAMQSANMEAE